MHLNFLEYTLLKSSGSPCSPGPLSHDGSVMGKSHFQSSAVGLNQGTPEQSLRVLGEAGVSGVLVNAS